METTLGVRRARPSRSATGERSRNGRATPSIDSCWRRSKHAGLSPNPEADRRALIRRVSLDLTGLPPKPDDVAAFLADTSPDAYEKVVAKLLVVAALRRAPRALLARCGTVWRHQRPALRQLSRRHLALSRLGRQGVQQQLPFDRFTVEQLAGDLLPNPTLDQLIATGFVRNNTTTNENGVIEEEVRFQYIKDRADTTGTVFLGLTVGCATCHDHKFDPISQKDHYALEAFFNNTTERIMDNNRPDPPPSSSCRPIATGRAGRARSAAKIVEGAHGGGSPGAERAVRRLAGIRARAQSQDPLLIAELLAVSADA